MEPNDQNRAEPIIQSTEVVAIQTPEKSKIKQFIAKHRMFSAIASIFFLFLVGIVFVQLFNGATSQSGDASNKEQTKIEMQKYLRDKYNTEFVCVKTPSNAGYYDPTGNNKTYLTEATFQKSDNNKAEFKVFEEKNKKNAVYYDGYIVVLTENAIGSIVEPSITNRLGNSTTKIEIDLGNKKVAKKYLNTQIDVEKFSQSENNGGRASINVYVNNTKPDKSAEASKIKPLLSDLKSLEAQYPNTFDLIDTIVVQYIDPTVYSVKATVYAPVGSKNKTTLSTEDILKNFTVN